MSVTMRLKHLVLLLLVLTLLGGMILVRLAPSEPAEAPAISLTTLKGEKIDLQSLRGRPLLVNFWATTCAPCLEEMPKLIALHRDYARQGLQIIGISMDYDRPDWVIAMSRSLAIPYPLALDIRSDAAVAFGDVKVTPTTFLIAPDGRIVYRKSGLPDMQRLRHLVQAMLAPTLARSH